MKNIREIFKYSFTVTLIVFIIGLVSLNKILFIGLSSSCLVSIFVFYLLVEDAKRISILKDKKTAKKIMQFGYAKRYSIQFIYLVIIAKFFGNEMFVTSVLGLFTVRMCIYFQVIKYKFIKYFSKSKKGGNRWEQDQ